MKIIKVLLGMSVALEKQHCAFNTILPKGSVILVVVVGDWVC